MIFNVRAMPRSSKAGLDGWILDALKVRVTCAPVDGQANKAIIEMLAKAFKVPKSKVRILFGETCRTKRVEIEGLDEARLREVAP